MIETAAVKRAAYGDKNIHVHEEDRKIFRSLKDAGFSCVCIDVNGLMEELGFLHDPEARRTSNDAQNIGLKAIFFFT
jgi:hypothetical protein